MSRKPSATPPWAVAGVCLGLVLLVGLSYAPVAGHEFIYCDDDAYVFENPMVRQGLTLTGAEWAFARSHAANWHPLTWLSHMLDVELFGLDAGAHHLVNAGLHALNAVLLLLLLWRLTGELWPSAIAAALFALHPLRVESVAWVAERKDLLCGLFFMLTLLAYAAYARRPGLWRYLPVFAALALGLMAKPMLVTLPFLLLLLDLWPLRRWRWARAESAPWESGARRTGAAWPLHRLVLEKLPLLALSALSSIVAVRSQEAGKAMGDLATLPFPARVANALVSYVSYLLKSVWPADLAIFYPHPALVAPESFSPLGISVVGAALFLLVVTLLALYSARTRPWLAVGWLWYLGMLVPVIGLVQVGDQAMADRYTYLPLIGIVIALVWGARDLLSARPGALRAAGIAAGVAALVLAAATWKQVGHWRDGEAIFRHAIAVTESNYFAHNHLGRAFENRGELDPAVEQYQMAVRIRPGAGALSNLGNSLAKRGEHQAAIGRFEEALRIDPSSADAHSNLGVVYGMIGDSDRAVAQYLRALEIDPEQATTHYNLGSELLRRGKTALALTHLERALALNPYHAGVAHNLGVAYVELGRLEEAVAAYSRTLELDSEHAGTRCNLGLVYEKLGRGQEAASRYQEALRSERPCAFAHRFFGYQRATAGDLDGALVHLERVLRLRPASADAQNDVGSIYAQKGHLARGRAHLEEALRLDPQHAAARKNLERLLAEQAQAERAPQP